VNIGAPAVTPENPRVVVSYGSGGPVAANHGPRLYDVHFTSPPIGDVLLRWDSLRALPGGSIAPLKVTFTSTDGAVLTCGLETVALGDLHSFVRIKIVCQDAASGSLQDISGFQGKPFLWNALQVVSRMT
jgi:hypothetical protein